MIGFGSRNWLAELWEPEDETWEGPADDERADRAAGREDDQRWRELD